MEIVRRARPLHVMVSTMLVLAMLTTGQEAYGFDDAGAANLVAPCLRCGQTPIMVTTEAGLRAMQDGGCYALQNDIVLAQGSKWSGITAKVKHFDGQGHVISGLKLANVSIKNSNGFFNAIDSGGVVENLMLQGEATAIAQVNANNGETIGFVAGKNEGLIKNVTVLNGSLTYQVKGNGNAIGGLVGNNRGQVENCAFIGNISLEDPNKVATRGHIGGISGKDNSANDTGTTPKNCFFFGSITGAEVLTAGSIVGISGCRPQDCTTNGGSVVGDCNDGAVTAKTAEELAELPFLWRLNRAPGVGCWQWKFDGSTPQKPVPCAERAIHLGVTAEATAVTKDGAVLAGHLASGVIGDIYGRQMTYGTDQALTQVVQTVAADGAFQVTVANLLPETVYYYRAEASNRLGRADSAIGSFRTLAVPTVRPGSGSDDDSLASSETPVPPTALDGAEVTAQPAVQSGLTISSEQLHKGAAIGRWVTTGEPGLSLSLRLEPLVQQQVLDQALWLSAMQLAPEQYQIKITEKYRQELKKQIFGQMRLTMPKAEGQWQAWDKLTGQPLPTAMDMVAGQPVLVVTCWQSGEMVLRPRAELMSASQHWAEQMRVAAAQRGITVVGALDEPITSGAFLALLREGLGIIPNAQSDLVMRRQLGFGTAVIGASRDEVMTRQEGIVYLMRAQRLVTGERQLEPVTILANYVDGEHVAQWAQADMVAAVMAGLVAGDGCGLRPEEPLSVAQAICLVMRLLDNTALI